MPKHRKFYNLEQASAYLKSSIIRVSGKPVHITNVTAGKPGKNFLLNFTKITDPNNKWPSTVLSDHEDVDMNPLLLGMLALDKDSRFQNPVYMFRYPSRAYKVGLTTNTLGWACVNPKDSTDNYAPQSLIYSKEFENTVRGKFLDYVDAKKASAVVGGAVPFSRRFAVDSKGIYYKNFGALVGQSGPVPTLTDDAFFLREALEEDLHAS